jgi:hypothetical protein
MVANIPEERNASIFMVEVYSEDRMFFPWCSESSPLETHVHMKASGIEPEAQK